MNKILSKLMIFDTIDTRIERFGELCQNDNAAFPDKSLLAVGELLEWGREYAICGNLWHYMVAEWVAMNENAFSLACERKQAANNSITRMAYKDIELIWQIFNFDLSQLLSIDKDTFDIICDFHSDSSNVYMQNANRKLTSLVHDMEKADNAQDFMRAISDFYMQYGVGQYAIYDCFRVQENGYDSCLVPIANADKRTLDDLVGYELQKRQVVQNTEAFLAGKPANNVLLYGDGGTGKSSTIKAIISEYSSQGLRIIEIYKHQFKSISNVISQIKNRNYKFVLYLDDLSFEEFEIEYKYFKAIIEGGLESRPNNVIIYATSNRRHLIKETWADKNDGHMEGEIHRNDTLQEKLSLVSRFGLSIFYGCPTKQEFLDIVHALAKARGLDISDEELDRKALQWDIRGGGRSGRSAQQFINSLCW